MPYQRPGNGHYTTNASGGDLNHGQPVKSDGFVGVAVKQKVVPWDQGLSAQAVIPDGEDFFLITKGIVQVPQVVGFAKGDPVYITSGNVLTETSSSNTKFGRVEEIEGQRGTPTGSVRVNLDAKDSF